MERLNLLRKQLSSKTLNNEIINSSLEYFNFDQFLTKEETNYRKKLREYLEREVTPIIPSYYEKAEFPLDVIKKLVANFPGILGLTLKGNGSIGMSFNLAMAVTIELARCDVGLCTFCFVTGGELIMRTINDLGNEEQRQAYLPKINKGELIASFCLTEAEYGSDATSIKTNVREENGELVLNGSKRWIGNADYADLLIVWARNSKNNQIEGYLVDAKLPGISVKLMTGKMSTRSVHNSDIKFDNVRIPLSCKLEKATNFQTGVNKMFLGSRLGMTWNCIGACVGAYDRVVEYCSKRIQFGKPITSFQLIQEKLARIMGNIQAMIYLSKRATDLYAQNELSIGKVGLAKAWSTARARETLAIAREIMGGNGILIDNWVMKTLLDLESVHTYEGTYEMNMLICARELTGISAFK